MQGLKGVAGHPPQAVRQKRASAANIIRKVLGPVETLLLHAVQTLEGEHAYGAEIQRHVEIRSGRHISLGQIYTTLDRLESKHLIRSHKSNPEPIRGGRTKRVFQLEELGVRALEEAVTLYTMNNSPLASNGDIHGIPRKLAGTP